MYSLREAAEAVGLGKPSILKAIQKGRISAKKNDLGQWEIDPAELHRVYKAIDREPLPDVAGQRQEPREETRETPENSLLKAKVESLQEQLNREREWNRELSRRLDDEAADRRQSAEELRRLTLLLTHQPEEKAEALPAIRGEERENRAGERGSLPPWVWLFVGAGLVAAAGAAFVWVHPELFPWTSP